MSTPANQQVAVFIKPMLPRRFPAVHRPPRAPPLSAWAAAAAVPPSAGCRTARRGCGRARGRSARRWRPSCRRTNSVMARATSPSPEKTASAPACRRRGHLARGSRPGRTRESPGWLRGPGGSPRRSPCMPDELRIRATGLLARPPRAAFRGAWRRRRRPAMPSSRRRWTVSRFSSTTVGSMSFSCKQPHERPAHRAVADDDRAIARPASSSSSPPRSARRPARPFSQRPQPRRALGAGLQHVDQPVQQRVEGDRDDRRGDQRVAWRLRAGCPARWPSAARMNENSPICASATATASAARSG